MQAVGTKRASATTANQSIDSAGGIPGFSGTSAPHRKSVRFVLPKNRRELRARLVAIRSADSRRAWGGRTLDRCGKLRARLVRGRSRKPSAQMGQRRPDVAARDRKGWPSSAGRIRPYARGSSTANTGTLPATVLQSPASHETPQRGADNAGTEPPRGSARSTRRPGLRSKSHSTRNGRQREACPPRQSPG